MTHRQVETGDVIGQAAFCDAHAAIVSFAQPIPRTATEVSRCRSCNAPVRWQPTAGGKMTPVDETGQPHWATCPDADAWRKK